MSTAIVGQQVWIGRPGRRYHDHALLYPGLNAPVPFLVHRHDGGEVAHGHQSVQSGPAGTHALDVEDVTPAEEVLAAWPMVLDAYSPADFARDLCGVRRRQADMEATLQ